MGESAVFECHPYASHQEALVAAVVATRGPVIELGCGHYSTPILHHLCRERPLVSVESDKLWAAQFTPYASGMHNIYVVDDFSDLRLIDTIFWDVAFVDHQPAERRLVDIKRLANHTRYIVVHDTDTESDWAYKFCEYLDTFKYRLDMRKCMPQTSVVSNMEPIRICG